MRILKMKENYEKLNILLQEFNSSKKTINSTL